jgi:ferritin-like metal-binding protein YciE
VSALADAAPSFFVASRRDRTAPRRRRASAAAATLGTKFAAGMSHALQPVINPAEVDMSVKNLEDLFVHELRDTLDAERQILKALPKLAKAAESEELRAAFEEHKAQTEQQVERLEAVFKTIDMAARGKHCKGMEGLLSEGEELVKEEEPGPALDAALIASAQKVEHYEIAAYGTLATYAKLLENDEALSLLTETLDEEKVTDEKLTAIASEINLVAHHESAE